MQAHDVPRGGYKDVWQLAYPNIVSMMLHNLMSIIDTIMIGTVGTAALAGVGLAQLVLATLFYLYKGTADSVLTYTAQYFGAQQPARCGAAAWQGLYIGGVMALLVVSIIPLVAPLFLFMRPAAATIEPGVTYLRLALIGESLGAFTLILAYFLRGLGDTKTPMRIALFGNLLNVLGNYLLIFGHAGLPRLGVAGAAISTTVSEGIVLALLLRVFLSRKIDRAYTTRRWVAPDWSELRRLLRIALPLSLQGLLEVGSFTLFTIMIGRMGTVQLALNHIVIRLMVFAFLPVQGLATATSTLVGQALGARSPEQAEQSGRRAMHLGLVYMGGLGLLFFCLPDVFLRIFTRDPQALATGTVLLRVVGAVQAFDALYWVCGGVLKGAGDTRWFLTVSTIYNWLIFLPLAFVFGMLLEWGIIGAWSGFAGTILFQGLTFWWRFERGAWKHFRIIVPAQAPAPIAAPE